MALHNSVCFHASGTMFLLNPDVADVFDFQMNGLLCEHDPNVGNEIAALIALVIFVF